MYIIGAVQQPSHHDTRLQFLFGKPKLLLVWIQHSQRDVNSPLVVRDSFKLSTRPSFHLEFKATWLHSHRNHDSTRADRNETNRTCFLTAEIDAPLLLFIAVINGGACSIPNHLILRRVTFTPPFLSSTTKRGGWLTKAAISEALPSKPSRPWISIYTSRIVFPQWESTCVWISNSPNWLETSGHVKSSKW